MLYKIEFLTIDLFKLKKDYELINASSWQAALNIFMDHEKHYLPVWIIDINSQFRWGENGCHVAWQKGKSFDDFPGIDQLNIDLGFSSDYNDIGL